MSSLQEKYPAEYKTYDLSSVAVAIVFPMIKAFLQVSVVLYPPIHEEPRLMDTP